MTQTPKACSAAALSVSALQAPFHFLIRPCLLTRV